MSDSLWQPIAEIAKDVSSGKVTAKSLVQKSLDIIKQKQEYKAIIATLEKPALKRAKEIDRQVKSGEQVGRLAGVPFIAKDNFLVHGADTTAASNILKGFRAPYQATAVELLENEGAICVAKANLDAFAHGSSTENSDFFVSRNPYDRTRVPGGSSGGSAVASALDMTPFTLGTDTGGSIRQPASFCGVIGYKPTYGLVSRNGVVAMGSSLDCIGPIAKSIDDVSLVLDVVSVKDELDNTMVEGDAEGYSPLKGNSSFSNIKIGVVKEFMDDQVDPSVRKVVERSITRLKKSGASVKEVSLPTSKLSLPVYYILCPAEVSSNLSRYDGQRYGYSYPDAKDLEESYRLSRNRGFGDENIRRIMIGTYVLSSGFYESYYQKAQTVRTKIIKEVNSVFSEVDLLMSPTTPSTAFRIGEKARDPISMYLSDLLTATANLTGIPAVSLPAGKIGGLPAGVQFMAGRNQDRQLLELSKVFEEVVK